MYKNESGTLLVSLYVLYTLCSTHAIMYGGVWVTTRNQVSRPIYLCQNRVILHPSSHNSTSPITLQLCLLHLSLGWSLRSFIPKKNIALRIERDIGHFFSPKSIQNWWRRRIWIHCEKGRKSVKSEPQLSIFSSHYSICSICTHSSYVFKSSKKLYT